MKDLHFASLAQSNRIGGLDHINLTPQGGGGGGGGEANVLADSPTQLGDTVSKDELELVRGTFLYSAPLDEKEPRTVYV